LVKEEEVAAPLNFFLGLDLLCQVADLLATGATLSAYLSYI
jgi:hypothetical protein